ncbi:hypothetical protein MZI66_19590, partial [Escherichia coli]|nr:hypothetical protein [Escherichia coli]
VSISVILFNSRFRSYGAQGVLKKHPFCGAFLVFWGFKFLSIKIKRYGISLWRVGLVKHHRLASFKSFHRDGKVSKAPITTLLHTASELSASVRIS